MPDQIDLEYSNLSESVLEEEELAEVKKEYEEPLDNLKEIEQSFEEISVKSEKIFDGKKSSY